MKKTIIFDFDGVIADSFNIAFAVTKITRPTLTFESYRDKFKTNINKAVFTEPENDTEIDFQGEYAKRMEDLKLSPAKKIALQELSEKYDFSIISSTDTKTISDFCEANGILQYFGDILGFDVEASKVKKFQTLFEKRKLDPKQLIFVTDTVGDIDEAREAGIRTIVAVSSGYQNKDVLQAAHPTFMIDSIANLKEVI